MTSLRSDRLRKPSTVIGVLLFALSSIVLADAFEEGETAYSVADFATAAARFEQAAKEGNASAQYKLGSMHHDGEGVPRDHVQSVYWYTKAAEQGNVTAQHWLCIMHREGMGVPRNYGEALYWCKRAANKGHAEAQFAVGQFYFDGLGNGFNTRHILAYIWFRRASLHDDPDPDAETMIERLQQDMTPLQIVEAERRALDWEPHLAGSTRY